MNRNDKSVDWLDYAVVHPLFLPLWVTEFGRVVETFSVGWFWLIPLCFFAFWFYSYLNSAPRLFAYYSHNTEKKEVLPCIQPANT